ncbi:hypothetical protein [Streptomyces sp. NPDC046985]
MLYWITATPVIPAEPATPAIHADPAEPATPVILADPAAPPSQEIR